MLLGEAFQGDRLQLYPHINESYRKLRDKYNIPFIRPDYCISRVPIFLGKKSARELFYINSLKSSENGLFDDIQDIFVLNRDTINKTIHDEELKEEKESETIRSFLGMIYEEEKKEEEKIGQSENDLITFEEDSFYNLQSPLPITLKKLDNINNQVYEHNVENDQKDAIQFQSPILPSLNMVPTNLSVMSPPSFPPPPVPSTDSLNDKRNSPKDTKEFPSNWSTEPKKEETNNKNIKHSNNVPIYSSDMDSEIFYIGNTRIVKRKE